MNSSLSKGILYGISVGTGDPELITVKGLKILQQSPVVAFPLGRDGKEGIAEKIVKPWLKTSQQKLPLYFPYVQDMQELTSAWHQAATKVSKYLDNQQDVAFVCEGDISFYSSFTYLAQTLQKLDPTIQIEMIPGVTAPMAAANALGIPLTIREQRLAILPGLYNLSELETALKWADVVVLMKFSSVYAEVWQVLAKYQLLETSMIVEKASLPEQVIYRNLCDRPNLDLSYFSLLLIFNNNCLEK